MRTVLWIIVLSASVVAQQTFEAASVKRNRTNGAGQPSWVLISGQRVSAPFVTARELIRVAYGVYENQVVNGPGWIDSDRFELGATIPTGASVDVVREMLRGLLAERFGLQVHQERRDLPVYTLAAGERLGPNLRPSGPECRPMAGPPGFPIPPPPPPPPAGAGPMTVVGQPRGSKCGSIALRGFLSARDIPMETFRYFLMRETGRLVLDHTNLTQRYDIDLIFLPDTGPMTLNGVPLNADAPSLTTAVREQLGLRLDSSRAPVDVVVIDRVSPPTDN